jgi:hypothetical protein
MKPDRTSFALGMACLALSWLGLWASWGQIDWRLAGMLAPIALVVTGVGMLLLTGEKH